VLRYGRAVAKYELNSNVCVCVGVGNGEILLIDRGVPLRGGRCRCCGYYGVVVRVYDSS
jgi:hypothetical protein